MSVASQYVPQPNSLNLKSLDGFERFIVAASVSSALAAMVFQQPNLALVPGFASLPLIQISRLRQEGERRNNQTSSSQISRIIDEKVNIKLGEIETKLNDWVNERQVATIQETSKYATKQHLIPFKCANQEFKQKHRALEMKTIPNLEKQVEELKKNLGDLETQFTEKLKSLTIPPSRKDSGVISSANPRVAVFIDEANIYHSSKELKESVDYKRLLDYLTGNTTNVESYLYTGVDPDNTQQQRFLYRLRSKGIKVTEKKLIERQDGSKKANMDVEIALGMYELQDRYDEAILVSGDGDFTCAVKKLVQSGKRVTVASFRGNTSQDLIDAAHKYIDLSASSVRKLICK